MAFGELKIVPSADIGELGPEEGTAVVYHWKWYYSVPALLLWAVLVLAIVLVKANRNPHALLILVPLLIVNLLWFGFLKLFHFASVTRVQFDSLFASYTVGITVLWLLAHKLGNRNRFVTFLLALVVMTVVSLVGAISYNMSFSDETTQVSFLLVVLAFTMLFGFVLAAWRCRKRYSGLRFMLCLGVWTIAVGIVSLLSFFVIAVVIWSLAGGSLPPYSILIQVFIVGLIFGVCLYVIVFPYMILALRSSFFRERFYACLRLKSMPTTVAQADVDQVGEQSQDPKTSENSGSV